MSDQYVYAAAVAGRNLTGKIYTGATLVSTADSVVESPANTGLYYLTFNEVTAHTGTFRLILTDDDAANIGVAHYRVAFSGADAEVVDAVEFVDTSGLGVVGSGSIAVPFTIQKDGLPVEGVMCWVTTDAAGLNVVAGTLITDDFGNVSFLLNAGVFYLWRDGDAVGCCFTNPHAFTVS